MSAATLFAVPEPALNPGTLYEETLKTVELIKETGSQLAAVLDLVINDAADPGNDL